VSASTVATLEESAAAGTIPDGTPGVAAIAATFTAEPLRDAFEFWVREAGLPLSVEFAPYNQPFQQLVDPSSLFARNRQGVNVLLVRLADWRSGHDAAAQARTVREFIELVDVAARTSLMPYIVVVCPSPPDDQGPHMSESRLEEQLVGQLKAADNVRVLLHSGIAELYPVAEVHDRFADTLGHVPFTDTYFAALATALARIITAMLRPRPKVVVVDCDDTLWSGACGELGADGVGLERGRRVLQETLVQLQRDGILLALCSKNAEADVWSVFESRAEMPLRREHFAAWRINWRSKADNLAALAADLGLGLDAFVLLDDNPLECAEARALQPEVLTFQVPADADDIPDFLRHVWALDRLTVTDEDRRRTALYADNAQREELRRSIPTFEAFLAALDVHVSIEPMAHTHLERVSQLTFRTNQFNTTTIRMPSERLAARLQQPNRLDLVVTCADRFGDYGLVGAVLAAVHPDRDMLRVEDLMLSCRSLGRGVENRILVHLGQEAGRLGLARVEFAYRATERNEPARRFLSSLDAIVEHGSGGESAWIMSSASAAAGAITPVRHDREAVELVEPAVRDSAAAIRPSGGSEQWQRIATSLRTPSQVLSALSQRRGPVEPPTSSNAPWRLTHTEARLAETWAGILGTTPADPDQDFFALGGDSLMALRVLVSVREIFGVDLSVADFLAAPSLAAQADQIDQGTAVSLEMRAIPVGQTERRDDIPLSFGQRRMWFLDRLVQETALHNILVRLSLSGPLDRALLHTCLQNVIDRHEVLRTLFPSSDGQPYQHILPSLRLPLEHVDLRGLPESERHEVASNVADIAVAAPFDLATGPLVRATLVQLADHEHVLLLALHHIVCDGWSLGVMFQEIETCYRARAKGRAAEMPALPLQYADYALWQHEHLHGETIDSALAYWQAHLAPVPEPLELPTDRPRPAVQTYRGDSCEFVLSAELMGRLRALARDSGATLFMTLLAGLGALLARYSGQDDLVVGTPVAGRDDVRLEPLIGFFVNTLALRIDVSGDPTFSELVSRVRTVTSNGLAHAAAPFDRVVDTLAVQRDLARTPLFQVLFVLQSAPMTPPQLPGITVRFREQHASVAKCDLTFIVQEAGDACTLTIEYSTDLFEASTVQRLADNYATLLRKAAADPERRVSALGLLSASERHSVVERWNDTAADLGPARCLHELIEEQVERTPDAIAVAFEGRSLTYRELNRRANRLARRLRTLKVGPEEPVAICAERSVELVVGLLGILKAGAAYVPLDPAYPAERRAFMLEDCRATVVLAQPHLAGGFAQSGVSVEPLVHDAPTRKIDDLNPRAMTSPEHLAYVIYTSGSTGQPKGAMNSHAGVVNRLRWMQHANPLHADDRVLQKTPFSFDVSVWEFFWPLTVGARLVVARPEGHRDARYLARLIRDEDITALHFVPSMLRVFLEEESLENSCASLRLVVCSGEALPFSLQERCLVRLPRATLLNLYGPTETAIEVTAWTCVRGDPSGIVPIGKPIANTQCYVLDHQLEPVPIGVPGELFLGGVQVGRGYLGRPALTAERFLPHPFASEPGARLYRTGDLVRWRPDGSIEFLGRLDQQVKLRGFRIELGEIEATLRGVTGIRDAAVVVREDTPGDPRLAAYVVGAVTSAELTSALRQTLPDYMVPSTFVTLDTLLLLPNGKLDRRALPAPAWERAETANGDRASCTPTEEILISIWEDILGVHPVHPNDDFFALGGHSLLAVQAITRACSALEVEVPLRAMFETPTVAHLAHRIERAAAGVGSERAGSLKPADARDNTALSPGQLRLWFEDQFEPGSAVYNVPVGLRLKGQLCVPTLERTLTEIVGRHDSLRTSFPLEQGWPIQRVSSPQRVDIPTIDLGDVAPDEREATAARLASEEALCAFDLAQGPPVRTLLMRFGDDEHLLVLTFHHIVFDGWSTDVLLRELAAIYDAFTAGAPSPLSGLPVQYADFAAWQHAQLQRPELAASVDYWRRHLEGAPTVLDLPADYPRPRRRGARAAHVALTVSPSLTRDLRAVGRREGVTTFMLVLAALQVALRRCTGQDQIVVTTPLANRYPPETEGLIGFFADTLALRGDLSGDPTVGQLLQQARETTLGAFAHRDVPFQMVVEALRPSRELDRPPLAQVNLAVRTVLGDGLRAGGLVIERTHVDRNVTPFDFVVELEDQGDTLSGRLTYNADVFARTTATRLASSLLQGLYAFAQGPDRQLSRAMLPLP